MRQTEDTLDLFYHKKRKQTNIKSTLRVIGLR